MSVDFFYNLAKCIYSPPSSINRVTRRNYKLLLKWITNKETSSVKEASSVCSEISRIIVDLGGGTGGRGSEILFSEIEKSGGRIFCVDLKKGSQADILCDLHELAIRSESADIVILQGVLEHVKDDEKVLKEAARIMAPQGLVYIEVPFIQGYHADPEDYRRFTEPGLAQLVESTGLEIIRTGPTAGPGASITAVLRKSILGFLKKGLLRHIMTVFVRWLLLPLLIIDMAIEPEKNKEISHGYFCLARKKGN
jgi:SAM-dependent methyltransferase